MMDESAPKARDLRLDDAVELERLAIRLDRCVTVVPGPVDPKAVSTLETRGYDQAPVYDPAANVCWGLVTTVHVKSLLESGQPLRPDDPVVRAEQHELHIGPFVSVFTLFEEMAGRRAVIVLRDSDATEYGHVESLLGLFTISDLNRHGVRSVIYRILAQVESGLARCLEAEFSDAWSWLKHLEEESQARVLGYWELAKAKGVDVGPVVALTLSQLIQIITRHDSLATKLGYPSRTKLKRATGPLLGLRNRVMHPIRPLILAPEDVAQVRDSLVVLEDMRTKIENALGWHHEA